MITGVSGLLGNNLACYFRNKYDILGIYNEHSVTISGILTERCDLADEKSLKRIIEAFDPSIVIHCASLTNIDFCESENELATRINILPTKYLSQNLRGDIILIYVSSDSVYDGVEGNISEESKVNPQNYYGLSKLRGEQEVLNKEGSLVLRTNIFGWNIQNKKSLGEWILYELLSNRKIQSFQDAYFSSIYTFELARIIHIAINKNLSGIFNCASSDSCSKYEFALKIADRFGLNRELVSPISIDDFGFKAKRGKNLSLNVNKIRDALDYDIPSVDKSIDAFYRDYKSGLPEDIRPARAEVREFLPYGRQWIDENDIHSVVRVLRYKWLTQGPNIEQFENALAGYCSVRHAIAANSGTSALHISCLAAEVQKGDEVITSPITFVASANCAVYCGAKPVFADIDKRTYNIAPEEIEIKITEKTKAIIPVHFAGQSCDMKSIFAIVKAAEKKYGHKIYIIEDASHALGSIYKNTKVGSCAFSDMAVMSFHPVKHITTGEGGVVLTNDDFLNKKLKRLRSHGITSTPEDFINKYLAFPSHDSRSPIHDSPNPWYYEQVDLGYNYRITNIQCALGISQLKRLDEFRRRRREIVYKYNEAFRGIKVIEAPYESKDCDSNFHLYVLLLDFEQIGMERAQFIMALRKQEIQTQVHYIPVHMQPYYRKTIRTKWGDYPQAEKYYQKCLSIPLFPAMLDEEVDYVIEKIKALVGK